MTALRTIWNSHYVFWALLALPSIPMVAGGLAPGADLESLLHPTGEFSARFMILAMMLTPLRMIFPKSGALKWLMRRRRYLGVAAFGYALLHTVYYLIDLGTWPAIAADALKLDIWTGWLAFVIFVPLALTSNDWSVRRLGPGWKNLQRLVYLAAIATLAHWIFVHNNIGPALVHFLPLAMLQIWRIWRNWSEAGSKPASAGA